jgi:hypothetical protein
MQTYILVDNDKTPHRNAMELNDVAICGDCQHRQGEGGACYVQLGRGPLSVWKQLQKGAYPESLLMAATLAKGRKVRLGSYGDPAAVPLFVWRSLLKFSAGWTGYTHAWHYAPQGLMHYCMASVDTIEELVTARAMGYRTFRVRPPGGPLLRSEFGCPASAEAGHRLQCQTCMACDGGFGTKKASPAIVVHGSLAKRLSAVIGT